MTAEVAPDQFCSRCGATRADAASLFCAQCGHPFAAASAVDVPAPQAGIPTGRRSSIPRAPILVAISIAVVAGLGLGAAYATHSLLFSDHSLPYSAFSSRVNATTSDLQSIMSPVAAGTSVDTVSMGNAMSQLAGGELDWLSGITPRPCYQQLLNDYKAAMLSIKNLGDTFAAGGTGDTSTAVAAVFTVTNDGALANTACEQ